MPTVTQADRDEKIAEILAILGDLFERIEGSGPVNRPPVSRTFASVPRPPERNRPEPVTVKAGRARAAR